MVTAELEEPVHIVVVGGGPAGATFAMLLVQFFKEKNRVVKVTVYESRIIEEGIHYRWRDENDVPRNRRRRQVITLQNSVLDLLPATLKARIDESNNVEEGVWRDSVNIPIMEYEDLTLKLIQEEPFKEMITFFPQKMELGNFTKAATPNCDLLVFADGSSSVAFNHPGIHKCSFGHSDYALGVPYHVSQPNSAEEATRLQNLNVAITVGQTRYLMNSLRSERGYLNIRLNSEEFKLLKQGDTLDDIKSRAKGNDELQRLRQVILDGILLFGIKPEDVLPFDIFPIQMHYSSCRYYQSGNYSKAPICLIGNAAMSVHFWPGRGANSGIKSAYALAYEVEKCSSSASRPYFQANSNNSLAKYESFMAALMCREQCGRSGIIAEVQLPTTQRLYEVFVEERQNLLQRILRKATDFGFDSITESHIIGRLLDVSKPSIYTMFHSRSWPPMGSCDINPRSYFMESSISNQSDSLGQELTYVKCTRCENLCTEGNVVCQVCFDHPLLEENPDHDSYLSFLDKRVNIIHNDTEQHLSYREDRAIFAPTVEMHHGWKIQRLNNPTRCYSIRPYYQDVERRFDWLDGRAFNWDIALLADCNRIPNNDNFLKWKIFRTEPNCYIFKSVASQCYLESVPHLEGTCSPTNQSARVSSYRSTSQHFRIIVCE